jgi:hypothetical protein
MIDGRRAPRRRRNAKEATAMATQAGVRVRESGDYYCTKCNAKVHVAKGERIPRCPQGQHEFRASAEADAKS